MTKELTVMSRPFDSHNIHSTLTFEPTLLDYSPVVPDDCDGLIDSCNGLLCFAIDQRLAVLYNPSIRKIKKLPNIDLPRVEGSTRYAFGYDPFIHNCKVIAIFSYMYDFHFGNYKTRVKIHSYTLGTDYWEMIMDFSSMFCFSRFEMSKHGVFVSGTVNWLAYHRFNGKTIFSLHLGKESYQEIPLPNHGNSTQLILEVMRDCLCLLSVESPADSFINVWLMKEYGNKDSWIKFIRLPCSIDFRDHMLLVYRMDCKFKWVVYDIKNDTIKSSKIEENLGALTSKVYVESLISP